MKTSIRPLGLVALAVLVFAFSTVGAVCAERQENSERLKAFLGLSDSQVSAIEQERGNLEKALQPHVLKMSQIQAQTETAIQSGDAATIGRAVLDRMEIGKQIAAERKASQDRIKAILTPQQLDKLNQAIEVLRFARADASFLGPLGLGSGELGEMRERAAKLYGEEVRRPNAELRGGGVPGGRKPLQ